MLKDVPTPLLKRIVFPPVIGLACLLVGLAFSMSSGDMLILVFSGFISAYCAVKTVSCYRQAALKEYDTEVVTCVGVTRKAMRQYQTIRLMMEDGSELLLYPEKAGKWLVGRAYRLYFAKDWRQTTSHPRVDAMLATDALIGYEEVSNIP